MISYVPVGVCGDDGKIASWCGDEISSILTLERPLVRFLAFSWNSLLNSSPSDTLINSSFSSWAPKKYNF